MKAINKFKALRKAINLDEVHIMYRVVSSSTKSTTLASTDIGSLKKFSKWNRTLKGSSNFSNVRVYLFVDTLVAIIR